MKIRGAAFPIALAGVLALAGCVELLPKASSEVQSPWKSYAQAKASIEKIVPFQTTAADLKAAGIDPFVNPNIQLLTYSDVVIRFPVPANLAMEKIEPGLRECLTNGRQCRGFAISVRETRHDRIGNFWLDALSFERLVETTGWSFNAVILTVGDQVVYTIYGGQPAIREYESNKQPLGPLQGWGDALPGFLR